MNARTGGRAARIALAVAGFLAAAALGFAFGRRGDSAQQEPPAEQLANTPNIILAIRSLARLESVTFHMERAIDLKHRQPRLFGLVHANDELLLIAVGEVIAGIDLAKMRDGDIVIEPHAKRARLRLPPPELLAVRLDNKQTYVHSRKTDMLAQRGDGMETRARQLAETSIRDAALSGGILELARRNAANTVSALVQSLGYDQVDPRAGVKALGAGWREQGRSANE